MMPFFLTMPISRMMPIHCDQAEIKPERHQCHERAETSRRQGRKDRQRMGLALIEHAQDDVDDDDSRGDEIRLAGQRRLEYLRVALGNCRSKSPARRVSP
jgi:hypothetical protein